MTVTDEAGRARFENIPGGVYCIKDNEGNGFKVGIKKLRQEKVNLYLTKQQKGISLRKTMPFTSKNKNVIAKTAVTFF